jgi:hypothetical protein
MVCGGVLMNIRYGPYKPNPIDSENNKPGRVAREAFRLLDSHRAPTVKLSDRQTWEISVLSYTLIVPKDNLDALKNGMVRAAMETVVLKASDKGRKPNFIDRLELAFTKWEIGRFIKEVARGQTD